MPLAGDLQRSLYRIFEQSERLGYSSVNLSAGELYRRTVRLQPAAPHFAISSAVMRSAAKPGDDVVHAVGDEVTICYRLPRPAHQRSRLFP